MGGARSRRAAGSRSYLGSEDGGLNELERAAVDLDEALASLSLGDSLLFQSIVSKPSFVMSGPFVFIVAQSGGCSSRWTGVGVVIEDCYGQSRYASCRSTEPSEGQP